MLTTCFVYVQDIWQWFLYGIDGIFTWEVASEQKLSGLHGFTCCDHYHCHESLALAQVETMVTLGACLGVINQTLCSLLLSSSQWDFSLGKAATAAICDLTLADHSEVGSYRIYLRFHATVELYNLEKTSIILFPVVKLYLISIEMWLFHGASWKALLNATCIRGSPPLPDQYSLYLGRS